MESDGLFMVLLAYLISNLNENDLNLDFEKYLFCSFACLPGVCFEEPIQVRPITPI